MAAVDALPDASSKSGYVARSRMLSSARPRWAGPYAAGHLSENNGDNLSPQLHHAV